MTVQDESPKFLPCGDAAFTMEFGTGIDRHVNARVISLYRRTRAMALGGIVEMVPTFRSLLVTFDPLQVHPADLQKQLLELLRDSADEELPGRRWRIPVCYGGAFGPDLEFVAAKSGLPADKVIETHAAQSYLVAMMGFLPGFAYMIGLPERLRLSRREAPRTHVPRGSLAIADEMTAIYPLESPGGWHLIGRCAVPLFDPSAEQPVLFAPGDTVTFTPVSAREYETIEGQIAAGTFSLLPEGDVS